MSVTAGAYEGFVAAAELTVQHLHDVLGLDLWMVTCLDALPRPEPLEPLLEEVGGGGADRDVPRPDMQVVVAAAGPIAQHISSGTGLEWATSYCRVMVSGETPYVAPDVALVPAYAALQEATSAYGFGTVRSYAGMPLRWSDGEVFGTVCGYGLTLATSLDERAGADLRFAADMLTTMLATHERGYWRAREVAAVRALAETDPLTGLANRRGWRGALLREQERLARYGHPASVLVIDLDNLKTINDTQGHACGDAALVALADVLRSVCRPADVIARTGGDEFAVLAVEAGVASGKALATRIRLELHRAGVHASVGVSSRRTGEDLMVTADRADAVMNVAKRRRRRAR
jgi:diguanylate cyclase (GGDEF)-like protein